MDEVTLLRGALLCYAGMLAGLRWQRVVMGLLALAVAVHTLALAVRWRTLGHGPFTTMYEILSSNLWSLALVFVMSAAAVPEVRRAWRPAFAVWAVLGGWLLLAPSAAGHFPATYATPLLYLHTVVGKLFLGLLLVAVSLSAGSAWRALTQPRGATGTPRPDVRDVPDEMRRDELAHRFAAFAFVFQGLMLIIGAVWAQDAWGRYWAWDPLESWAFLTWLALAATLHARATFRPRPWVHALALAGVFVLAFLTFFGVPFISTSPHKGAL